MTTKCWSFGRLADWVLILSICANESAMKIVASEWPAT